MRRSSRLRDGVCVINIQSIAPKFSTSVGSPAFVGWQRPGLESPRGLWYVAIPSRRIHPNFLWPRNGLQPKLLFLSCVFRSTECPCRFEFSLRLFVRALNSGGLTSINLRLIYRSISASRFEIHDMGSSNGHAHLFSSTEPESYFQHSLPSQYTTASPYERHR